MIASEKANHSKKIGRNKLDYFRKNIESWEKMGEKESLDGDAELATILTEGVTDLRKIL